MKTFKYNATQKQIEKDGTKVLMQLRKAEQHREADRFGRWLAEQIEKAAS